MALPDLLHVPVQTTEVPKIRMPGGAVLAPIDGIGDGDPMKVIRDLFGQINAALAPLSPIFNLIDTVIAIKDCILAIPSFVANPQALFEAIEKLLKAIGGLAALLPQLSVPILVADVIRALVFLLIALKQELLAIIEQTLRMDRANAKAAFAGNDALVSVLQKAQENLDKTQANQSKSMAPIDQLIKLVNSLLDIAQVPNDIRLPTIADLGNARDALDVIDVLIEVLQTIASALPI